MASREKNPSKGSVAFAAMMAEHGAQKNMAGRLGEKQDRVSRWASGESKPNVEARAKLEKLGIGWRDWDLPPDAPGSELEREEASPESGASFRPDRTLTPAGGVG